ncbi:ABC transporter permease [Microvirga thermotolerans]|uniref:ABC transporter permease n=1 Tax=Microvirga thermotolerans TaxID=2651334 RepID=A0A5P9JW98_9HYPH|nr:ABC transporter permease [Microvirga thermotolerans]QFU15926.1 ABC transporter permease [Microvirga thermotolerans]
MSVKVQQSPIQDILEGLVSWRLWIRFGWHDVVARYRRSWLGPFWLIAAMSIFVVALGVVYSTLFKVPIREYLPFVAIGTVVWQFLSAVATESVQTFVEAESYIKQVRRSPVLYVFRVVWRNTIVFFNQFVVGLFVAIACGQLSLAYGWLAILGLVLLLMQAWWVTLLVGVLGSRFRDLLPIVTSLMQILFFITPVLWPPSALGTNAWIAQFNPLYHLLETIRGPLLGQVPSLLSYAVTIGLAMCGMAVAYAIYARFRSRIVYWL